MKEYKYKINGKEYNVTIDDVKENIANVTVNGENFSVELEKKQEPEKKKVVLGKVEDTTEDNSQPTEKYNGANAVKAPLPGTITEVSVAVGDVVEAGKTVVLLEAMKMSNKIEAEKDGRVTAIYVKVGQSVMEDDPLVVIE